ALSSARFDCPGELVAIFSAWDVFQNPARGGRHRACGTGLFRKAHATGRKFRHPRGPEHPTVNMLRARPVLSLYLSLLLLGLATYFGGTHGISAVRVLYLFGCVGVAVHALRFGTAYHFEALVVLFAFSPYLRRIVDYGCGFEVHGYMLTGPLLAALIPTTAL